MTDTAALTETEPKTEQPIPQDILDEAMMPELSDEFFELPVTAFDENGKETKKTYNVQIKPLYVRYQKLFAKMFSPVISNMSLELASNQYRLVADDNGKTQYQSKGITDLTFADWMAVASSVLEQVDVLPRLVQILCHNDRQMVTDEEMEYSEMQLRDMQDIVMRYLKKSGDIEKRISDFFMIVLPVAEKAILEQLDQITEVLQKGTESLNTASSSNSASDTESSLPTSAPA